MHGLLDAITTISSELDLQVVLRRIAQAAADLADAEYAALGVVSPEGHLSQFVTVGLDPEAIAAIGPFPHGRGLLGELITDPQPLRLGQLDQHPSSVGFPAHHPQMKSFLGVPIRVHGRVFGNLYLTDKRSGDFDEADEEIVNGLAAAAGISIENARLYEQSRRREQNADAGAEITRSLLSDGDSEVVLELVGQRIGDLLGAELGLIALRQGEQLVVEVVWGGEGVGTVLDARALLSRVLASESPVTLDPAELPALWPGAEIATAAAVSVGKGFCLAARTAPARPFSTAELTDLAAFAAQATVALELAQRRREAERLTVYADRDRIARDLHDLVIQRLFATGMQLEGAVRQIDSPPVQARVRQAVDDLDQTIKEIRSTIYALSHDVLADSSSLRARLLEVLDAAEEMLGFAPSVRMSGLLDTAVSESVGEHVLSVLREALSNVARHAGASTVDVDVEADSDVLVRVVDNGVGLADNGRRSGLQHMAERAVLAGGTFTAARRRTGGTELEWRAPLSAPT